MWEPHMDYLSHATVDKLERQTASFEVMLRQAGKSPGRLCEVVARHTAFRLTRRAARRVLERAWRQRAG